MTSAANDVRDGLLPHGQLADRALAPRSTRLWSGLARRAERRQPARGADAFGEWLWGLGARCRRRRPRYPRASDILARARALSSSSNAALDERIAAARESVVLGRGSRAAIDEAFAVAHEVVRREIGLDLHPEQVLAALAMADGCCAELATGEGKTVTAILAAAVLGWSGRGVHVITVNDYLARRDAETTGAAYRRLGLSVGVVQETSATPARWAAYARDITYASDKQVLFDYLRDRLASPLAPRIAGQILDDLSGDERARWSRRVVQRGLHAAIVDEADSVLIDDAVTPAIISGPMVARRSGAGEHLTLACRLAASLTQGDDYLVDRRAARVTLTQPGRDALARRSQELPPFWSGPRRREELVVQALTARELYRRGDEYIVKDGAVHIVDRSTGRVLPGRQWQLGLHQAVEAKEGLDITDETQTTARESYQQFFQRYEHLCGMTGTAREAAAELWRWYRLPVVRVPTHRPVIRTLARDRVYNSERDKLLAVAQRVEALHRSGRPVLCGTRSVEASERLAAMVRERGIACDVLNALHEDDEAAIIERAGRAGAVTVATNMAGRGTDIRLDPAARAAGGLAVIATERHDEARVDRQLFGRAGRQGDPGSAEAFVSLEDELIERHGFGPLARLVRVIPPGPRGVAAALLWRVAQRHAGRRWATARATVAQGEAWYGQALHQISR